MVMSGRLSLLERSVLRLLGRGPPGLTAAETSLKQGGPPPSLIRARARQRDGVRGAGAAWVGWGLRHQVEKPGVSLWMYQRPKSRLQTRSPAGYRGDENRMGPEMDTCAAMGGLGQQEPVLRWLFPRRMPVTTLPGSVQDTRRSPKSTMQHLPSGESLHRPKGPPQRKPFSRITDVESICKAEMTPN